ncbi:MAG: hypothetical protein HY719_00610, partial [Planctomycetes bacterium]|nr:hypothetical protein [Planctomycetota bacterium]
APGDAASGAGGGAGGGQPVDFRAINERLGVTSTRDIVAENQRLLREGKTTGFLSFADDPGPAQPAAPGK